MCVSITCKICNQSFKATKFLFHHLNSTHKTDKSKYVEENFSDFIEFGWKRCLECNIPFVKGTLPKCGKCFSKNHKRNEDQYIDCKICNKPIHSKVTSIHLKSHHNIEFLDYVDKNLSDFVRFNWARCEICNKVTKSYAKKGIACSTSCSAKLRENWTSTNSPAFGHVHSSETREIISKKAIKRLQNKKNHPFFGKHHTEESRGKMSISHTGVLVGEKMACSAKPTLQKQSRKSCPTDQ